MNDLHDRRARPGIDARVAELERDPASELPGAAPAARHGRSTRP